MKKYSMKKINKRKSRLKQSGFEVIYIKFEYLNFCAKEINRIYVRFSNDYASI